ncbi:MAG TPA: hypothetical protein VFN71_16240 [Methylomirabilota bacterium]|nr:hypothetical protein [Methylomirabilota bacterium]
MTTPMTIRTIRVLGLWATWIALALALATTLALTMVALEHVAAQSLRQIKVILDFQQQGTQSRQAVEGSGGVIVTEKRGDTRVRGRGGVAADDTTTRTRRSTGVFTLVQDGGTATLLVAQDVPYPQVAYYHDYAVGKGYVASGVAWKQVGTALSVGASVLPDGQIRVRLTPRISYFTPGGGGAIDLVEAATELIVPNGRRVQMGGATQELHAVTRRILGYRQEQAASETSLGLTATIQ